MNDAETNLSLTNQRFISTRDAFLLDKTPTIAPSQYQTLSGLLRVLRRRWITVAVTGLVVFALGTSAYSLIKAYSATTIIEINKDDPSDNDVAHSNGPALTSDDIKNEAGTDVSILQTDDDLALAVIKKLNLIKLSSFKKAVDSTEKDQPLDEAPRTRDKALDLFRRRLTVASPSDTRLITITFKGSDPILAANVTNTLARAFIDDTLARRQRSLERSSAWLQHELGDLKKQVEQSEQRLADYERNTGLAGIELAGSSNGNGSSTVSVTPQNTVTSRLFSLNQELTTAEANRVSAGAVYDLVKTQDPDLVLGFGPMSVSSGTGNGSGSITPEGISLISSLRAQEADLDRELAAAVVKYASNNPRRIQLQQQLDAVKQQMQAELERIRLRAGNSYQYAKQNEDAIRGQFTKQQTAAIVMADKSVKLQLLAQEAFSNRALYDGLYSKLQTATLASGTRATRIDIVSEAIPAGLPNMPKLVPFFAIMVAMVIFLGISAAFLRESFDETVRTPQDLAEVHGLTLLGYVPRFQALRLKQTGSVAGQVIEAHPRSPFSEAFRALRTSIGLANARWANGSLFSEQDSTAAAIAATGVPVFVLKNESPGAVSPKRSRTMLVTSALGGAGKTTVTYNLGVAFAQQGARVLLIDADLRNPDLHRLFSTSLTPGLSEACGNDPSTEVSGIVRHSTIPTLFMLPAGQEPELPSELFGSLAFDSVLWKLSRLYDYVLIDSPPLLALADASIIATKVSAITAVVRSRSTTRQVLSALVQAMQRTHVPVLSLVLNDVRHPKLDGFYDYSYSRL
jgi:polysaccharide biosynthesis transport protein